MPRKVVSKANKSEIVHASNERNQPPDERECGCVTNVYCGEQEEEKKDCYCCHKMVETCTFDIYMTRVRVVDNKWLDGKAELMITGYANGQSAVFPGMGTWIVLHKKWGWRNIRKRITSITLEKGTSRVIYISADAIEVDGWLGAKWEIGSGDAKFLNVQCGQQTGVNYILVDIMRAFGGAGVTCTIEIEFAAFQVTA